MLMLTGNSSIEAVIFDMDGVLVDSEPIYCEIEKQSFLKYGVTLMEEEHHAFVGVTLENMWRQIKNHYQLEPSLEEMLAFHQENVFAVISAHTNLQPISHVERLIRELVEQRVPIAVASSSSPALIEMILTKSNLKSYFSVIVSGEEVSQGKPAPDIFLHAAKELGVSPSVCLVIEDSHHGVKAAKSAGMRCIGYQNLNSGKQDLSCADHIVTSYEELWRLQIK